ncbi:MAG: ATP-binding protein [Clostridia bacterium]|nr:ATP-binding protein [Clostridia bacterium]
MKSYNDGVESDKKSDNVRAETENADSRLLKRLAEDMQGGTAIYRVERGAISPVRLAENLAGLAGYGIDEYRRIAFENCMEHVFEDDRPLILKRVMDAANEQGVNSLRFRIKRKDGECMWVNATYLAYAQSEGCFMIKAAYLPVPLENKPQNTNDALISNLPCGICLFKLKDGKFSLMALNPVVADVFGNRPIQADKALEEMFSFVHPDDRDGVYEYLRQSMYKRGGNYEYHYRIWSKKKNDYIWIEMRAKSVRENGETLIYVTYTDVTGAVRIRDRLMETMQSLRTVLNYGNIGMWKYVIDDRKIFRYLGDSADTWNTYDEELYPEDFVAQDIIYRDDCEDFLACYRRIDEGAENSECTVRAIVRGVKEHIWLHISLARQEDSADGHRQAIGLYTIVDEEIKSISKLEQSQQMMQLACAASDMSVLVYNIDEGSVILDKRLQERYGRDEKIYDFPRFFIDGDYLYPDDKRVCADNLARLAAGEKEVCFDVRARQSDATLHWFRFKGTLIKSGSNMERVAVISVQPVDTEKVKEARLELEREKMRSAPQNLLYYYMANVTRNIVVEYRGFTMGKEPQQECPEMDAFVRQGYSRLTYEEDRKKAEGFYDRGRLVENYKKGILREEYEAQMPFKNGSIGWAKHLVELLQDPVSGDILLYEYVYDVSRERMMDAVLELELNSGYKFLGFLVPKEDQFTILRLDKGEKYDMKVVPFREYMREYAQKCVHPEDAERFLSQIPGVNFETCETGLIEVVYRTVDEGCVKHYKGTVYTYEREGKRLCTLTCRDYTAIIHAEEEEKTKLANALKNAEDAAKAKSEFLARMSHDMRTPINAIVGLTSLTIDAARDPVEIIDNMTKMRTASDFLLSLVNDILDMAKIEDKSISLNYETYVYSEFLMNMRAVFAPQCEQKGITLKFKEPRVNPVIRCDKKRLNQILFNLLSNAVKYTPEGGLVEYTVNNLVMGGGRLDVDLIVKDNGIGMSEEFQKHMFEPFAREHNAVTAQLQGSGLGLSITKQLVELMGGKIRVQSERGVGTTVTVSLSFECLNENADDAVEEVRKDFDDDFLVGKKVLLAEDHPLNAEIAERLLKKMGITTLWAENGRIAVDMFAYSKANEIDAILMDIRMPEMSGLEAAKAIRAMERADAKSVPIIALSANAYPEDIRESAKSGINEHVSKPIEYSRLRKVLEKHIRLNG